LNFSLATILTLTFLVTAAATESDSVEVGGGLFKPLLGLEKEIPAVKVESFRIDRRPVTNREFFRFAADHKEWGAKTVNHSLADQNYLKQWKEKKIQQNDSPVVNVSWFAASAFCEFKQGRLPTTNEWEFVASADETAKDARGSNVYRERILKWYASPSDPKALPTVARGVANVFGIYHLHGLIWELTDDFNTFFIMMDSRGDGGKSKDLFCGAGAAGANDREDYPAFMRYAMRASLTAQSAQALVGFRCAYDK
jgi:formylglycine-generating enzyme required for sulfatase activity